MLHLLWTACYSCTVQATPLSKCWAHVLSIFLAVNHYYGLLYVEIHTWVNVIPRKQLAEKCFKWAGHLYQQETQYAHTGWHCLWGRTWAPTSLFQPLETFYNVPLMDDIINVHNLGLMVYIPPSCGTNKNERMHEYLNRCGLAVRRIGPELAEALLEIHIFKWNQHQGIRHNSQITNKTARWSWDWTRASRSLVRNTYIQMEPKSRYQTQFPLKFQLPISQNCMVWITECHISRYMIDRVMILVSNSIVTVIRSAQHSHHQDQSLYQSTWGLCFIPIINKDNIQTATTEALAKLHITGEQIEYLVDHTTKQGNSPWCKFIRIVQIKWMIKISVWQIQNKGSITI